MAFELTLAIGGGRYIHPDQLLRGLSWRQFVDWVAFAELDPWGPQRDDLRQAAMLATLAAAFSDTTSPPGIVWPYWDAAESSSVDVDALQSARAAHLARFGYELN